MVPHNLEKEKKTHEASENRLRVGKKVEPPSSHLESVAYVDSVELINADVDDKIRPRRGLDSAT